MSIIKNLTTKEVENIQIDESVSIINYGESDERPLLPCRGGGEFSATVNLRNIEFDGRNGPTAGTQVVDEQNCLLKLTTINMSTEQLALAIPFCRIYDSNGTEIQTTVGAATIKNPKMGIVPTRAYLKNIVTFAKTVGGTYKKITIYNPMNEGGISFKAVQKAEAELSLEMIAHYTLDDLDGEMWEVTDVDSFNLRPVTAAQSEQNGTEQTPQSGEETTTTPT